MRIGVTLGRDEQGHPADARRAEQLGFDLVSAGEHLFFHGPTPNAFVSLAAAAGATERIRLLSSLTIAPIYPAALLAKLVAGLDLVSGGRFDLGIGVGGEYPPEFEAAGVDPTTRGARTDEALELMRALFTGEPVDFDGRFTRVPGLALQSPPVQRPGPPVWVGGRKPAAMRRAARFGDVWLPYMYTPEKLASSLAEIREEAARLGRPADAVSGAVFIWTAVDTDAGRAREQVVSFVSEVYQQDFGPLADRYLLHGSPETVIARLRDFFDAGADTVVVCPATADDAQRERMTELLASEVRREIGSWRR